MCGLYHYVQRMCSISFITLTEIFFFFFFFFFKYKYKGVETSLVVMKLLKSIANDLFAYNRQTQSKVLTSNAQELISFRSNYNM